MRPGEVVLDVIGQVCPERDAQRRGRRRAGVYGVPDEGFGPGGGARSGARRTPPREINQRAGRYRRPDVR
ncbi:hypothetical protein GCM10017556_50910 [Micromonospora sagamiensis]|nr:hypothetical protein GCM10017556_50910 [Micromonospora sagamiensis]